MPTVPSVPELIATEFAPPTVFAPIVTLPKAEVAPVLMVVVKFEPAALMLTLPPDCVRVPMLDVAFPPPTVPIVNELPVEVAPRRITLPADCVRGPKKVDAFELPEIPTVNALPGMPADMRLTLPPDCLTAPAVIESAVPPAKLFVMRTAGVTVVVLLKLCSPVQTFGLARLMS